MNDEMKQYAASWAAIEDFQRQELRQSSIGLRWQQLNAIFNLAQALGLRPERNEEEEMAVILRWAEIKDKYEKSRNDIGSEVIPSKDK
jgi:hypothetical protein